jgi:hypothetical protein
VSLRDLYVPFHVGRIPSEIYELYASELYASRLSLFFSCGLLSSAFGNGELDFTGSLMDFTDSFSRWRLSSVCSYTILSRRPYNCWLIRQSPLIIILVPACWMSSEFHQFSKPTTMAIAPLVRGLVNSSRTCRSYWGIEDSLLIDGPRSYSEYPLTRLIDCWSLWLGISFGLTLMQKPNNLRLPNVLGTPLGCVLYSALTRFLLSPKRLSFGWWLIPPIAFPY